MWIGCKPLGSFGCKLVIQWVFVRKPGAARQPSTPLPPCESTAMNLSPLLCCENIKHLQNCHVIWPHVSSERLELLSPLY